MYLPDIVNDKLLSLGARASDSYLVAVSGGADSTALLLAIVEILGKSDRFTACHLDHGVRQESEVDRQMVTDLCRNLGVKLVTGRIDQDELVASRNRYRSLEAGMRLLRYQFFKRISRETGSRWVLTGHTADDQAETILFRVIRKMDWRSFGGIPERRGMFLRPLLKVPGSVTLEFCTNKGIIPFVDSSNFDENYTRNRIRNRILPGLEGAFHPQTADLLRDLGRSADRLSSLEKKLLAVSAGHGKGEEFDHLDRDHIANVPDIFRRRIVVDYLKQELEDYPSRKLTDNVLEFIQEGRNGRLSLPGDSILVLSYGKALVEKEIPVPERDFPHEGLLLPIPGRLVLSCAKVAVSASVKIQEHPGVYPKGNAVLLSRKNLIEPLMVRIRKPGDRFRPIGMSKSKKLKNFMADRKIPRMIRDRIPLLIDGEGEIVWVGGVEISQKVALEGMKGEQAILLELEELSMVKGQLETWEANPSQTP